MTLDPALPDLLPDDLEGLLDALAAEGPSERPWLPPVPASSAANIDVWLRVVEAVEPLLASDDYVTQHQALKVLTLCPVPGAAALAARFLDDDRALFVATACDALARCGATDAAKLLIPLLDHADGQVRWRVAGGLGLTGDPAAAPALRRRLKAGDEESLVVRWGALSLAELGQPRDRALLEQLAGTVDDSLAREGIRQALERYGVVRDDLTPSPELARHARAASAGDPDAVRWLASRYRDPDLGRAAQAALLDAPEAVDPALIALLEARERSTNFGAADAAGWRGLDGAREALRTVRDTGYDPPGALAAGVALLRLGDDEAEAGFQERWIDADPPDRANESRSILALAAPLPTGAHRVLLSDPCALVIPAAAQAVARDARKDLLPVLLDALSTEGARVRGTVEPRDPYENEVGNAASMRSELVHAGEAFRSQLPPEVRDGARALEVEELEDLHVLAARSLLLATTGFAWERVREAVEAFLDSPSALLRLTAVALWTGASGVAPTGGFSEDPHPTVRQLWANVT